MDDLEQPEVQDSDAANTAADESTVADDVLLDDDNLDLDSKEQPEEEEDEIEVDGKKFAMPKSAAEKLKAERLMHADYTQKTQAVAEERKAIAAQREQVQRQQQEAQKYIDNLAELRSIDRQLEGYSKLDWEALIDQAPQDAMKLQQQQKALETQRHGVVGAITQQQEQDRLVEQQNLAKQVQEAEAYFKREIPNWSAERSNQIMQFAVAQGLPAELLSQAVLRQPALALVLHKAEMFDQLEKKQATNKPKPPVQEKPVTRITATRASVQRDPAKMSDADWLKNRQEKQRKR